MAQKGEMMQTYKRICPCCGKPFETRAKDKQFCDRACFYASRTGMSRTEWLLEHGQYTSRVCHDCGKPTNNYRCPDCWDQRRRTADCDDVSPVDCYGEISGHPRLEW